MNADRIDRLHERASERYLNGDYQAAIAAWRELLALDPSNEQALEGVRMSETLGGDAADQAEPAAPDPGAGLGLASLDEGFKPGGMDDFLLESEIEEGLSVLNGLEAPTTIPPAAAADPSRQDDGIDFGEIGDVAAIPLAAAPERGAGSGGASRGPGQGDESDSSGVDLLGAPDRSFLEDPGEPASVAEEALRRRVVDLLGEARACRERGEIEDALAVIARIYILDEGNAAAQELEAELRAPVAGDLRQVEDWIVEGVQAFDQGRLEDAKRLFDKVLELLPGHREAIHYLDAIAKRADANEGSGDDLLGGQDLLGDIPLARPVPEEVPAFLPEARPSAPPEPKTGPVPSFNEVPLPARRRQIPLWAIPAAIGVVVVLVGAILAPRWMGGGSASADPAGAVADSPRAPRGGARASRAAASTKPPRTAPPERAAVSPDEAMREARAALSRGDYGAAVLAFNEVLSLEPAHAEGLAGIRQAGELYKAQKAEKEQLDRVKMAFSSGEYASALRVLYRLPASYDKATLDRWKVHGWFNLGVVALRAGETRQAVVHFDEALAILADPDVSKWRLFAQQYHKRPKDRTFYAAAEAIPFRVLD